MHVPNSQPACGLEQAKALPVYKLSAGCASNSCGCRLKYQVPPLHYQELRKGLLWLSPTSGPNRKAQVDLELTLRRVAKEKRRHLAQAWHSGLSAVCVGFPHCLLTSRIPNLPWVGSGIPQGLANP